MFLIIIVLGGLFISNKTGLFSVGEFNYKRDYAFVDTFENPSPALSVSSGLNLYNTMPNIPSFCKYTTYEPPNAQFICNDGLWETTISHSAYGESMVVINNNNLKLYVDKQTPSPTAKLLVDLKRHDIFLMESGISAITLGNAQINTGCPSKEVITASNQKFTAGDDLCAIEVYASKTDKNKVYVTINNQKEIEYIIGDDPLYLTFTGEYDPEIRERFVYFIQKKVPFDCNIGESENEVTQEFDEGSLIQLYPYRTLKYSPIKFCSMPQIRKIGSDGGIEFDERKEILDIIQSGGSYIVSQGQTITISSVVPLVEGMSSCDKAKGEIWSTTLYKCVPKYPVKTITEIEEKLINCISDQDCYVPQNCPETFKGCNLATNKCDYDYTAECPKDVIYEEIVKVETIREYVQNSTILPIIIKNNQFTWRHAKDMTNSFLIGKDRVTDAETKATCSKPGNVDFMDVSCLQTTLNFKGKNYVLNNGDSAKISDCVDATYYGSGKLDNSGLSDFGNLFIFTLNLDCWDIEGYEYNKFSKLNAVDDVKFSISNKIADFSEEQAGFYFDKEKKFVQTYYPTENIKRAIATGTNTFSIEKDTETLGLVNYVITPYFKITADNEMVFKTKQPSMPYYVSEKDETQEKATPKITDIEKVSIIKEIPTNLIIVAIALVIIVIFVVIGFIVWIKNR